MLLGSKEEYSQAYSEKGVPAEGAGGQWAGGQGAQPDPLDQGMPKTRSQQDD